VHIFIITGPPNGLVLFCSLASVVVCRGVKHSTAGLHAALQDFTLAGQAITPCRL